MTPKRFSDDCVAALNSALAEASEWVEPSDENIVDVTLTIRDVRALLAQAQMADLCEGGLPLSEAVKQVSPSGGFGPFISGAMDRYRREG